MNTPVLFIIFNRPDTTQKVFDAIRRQKPEYLFVAADGPRPDKQNEREDCEQTRNIVIQQIDWPCELKTLFRDENLGCKTAVSSAVTWFFDNVEQGIILEDDCLPDSSFFRYCEELLIKYKDDDRIGHIGGNNFLPDFAIGQASYDFCSFAHIWGWATWRRVWREYDVNFNYWMENSPKSRKNIFNNFLETAYFSSFISDAIQNRHLNTWDVQYLCMLRLYSKLSVYPSRNLVTNIGLNVPKATHVSRKNSKLYIPSTSMSFPLEHPKYICRNKMLDKEIVLTNFFSWTRLLRYFLRKY
ncbi:MAG: hypothetical protein LBR10_09210 [Prevotellaceae bacterium]|jgi:hypothetical protein|nr:hypothetical protein [Prevotellaceae bacterium]